MTWRQDRLPEIVRAIAGRPRHEAFAWPRDLWTERSAEPGRRAAIRYAHRLAAREPLSENLPTN
jgi:hypothetical protein